MWGETFERFSELRLFKDFNRVCKKRKYLRWKSHHEMQFFLKNSQKINSLKYRTNWIKVTKVLLFGSTIICPKSNLKTKRYYFSCYFNSIVQFMYESVLLYRLSNKYDTEKIVVFLYSVSYFVGHPMQKASVCLFKQEE